MDKHTGIFPFLYLQQCLPFIVLKHINPVFFRPILAFRLTMTMALFSANCYSAKCLLKWGVHNPAQDKDHLSQKRKSVIFCRHLCSTARTLKNAGTLRCPLYVYGIIYTIIYSCFIYIYMLMCNIITVPLKMGGVDVCIIKVLWVFKLSLF